MKVLWHVLQIFSPVYGLPFYFCNNIIWEVKFFISMKFYFFFFLAVLDLHFCAWAFSSCGMRGLLFVAVHRLLIVVASHCGGFSCCGAWALGAWASVVVVHGLYRAGSVVVAHGLSCSTACGNFPDQGLNLCPLHWQADSQPLHHQRSPWSLISWYFV